MSMPAVTTSRSSSLRALMLNADGRPLSTWPLQVLSAREAIEAVWHDKATVVETWEDAFFHSPSAKIAVPKVMMLREYVPVHSDPKFCRASIFLRDKFRCQYCGQQFDQRELTYDHVIPRTQGGKTEWDNIVTACIECNAIKRDQHAKFSGRKGVKGSLRPLKTPRRPTTAELLRAGLEFLPKDIKLDFGSWLYWGGELQA